MSRTKEYFTFREELYRTHWAFSGLSKDPAIKRYRKMMWNAMPFQFDPQVSAETLSLHSDLAVQSFDKPEIERATPSGTAMSFRMSIPESFGECRYWHMPAGIVWAETSTIKGHRIGMLYAYKLSAQSAIVDDALAGLDPRYSTQQGLFLFFLQSELYGKGKPMTFAGRFATGEALKSGIGEDGEKIREGVLPFTAIGNMVDNIDEAGDATDMLIKEETMSHFSSDEIASLASMAAAHVLPFLRVFNATPIRKVVPRVAGYTPSDTFAGDKFPMLNDRMIKHDLGLQGSIMIRYDYDSVASGRRHAYHELAGYWRTRKDGVLMPRDKWIWVREHTRGDPSLGMSKRTYEKVKSDPTVSARYQDKMRQRQG